MMLIRLRTFNVGLGVWCLRCTLSVPDAITSGWTQRCVEGGDHQPDQIS